MDHGHGAARRSHSFLSRTALSSCAVTVASCGREGTTSTVSFELGVWAEKQCRRWPFYMCCFFRKPWVITVLYSLHLMACGLVERRYEGEQACHWHCVGEPPPTGGLATAAASIGRVEGSASESRATSLVSSGNFLPFLIAVWLTPTVNHGFTWKSYRCLWFSERKRSLSRRTVRQSQGPTGLTKSWCRSDLVAATSR
jgi:hypothetical protein